MTGVALALLGIAGVGLAMLGVEGRALRRRLRGTVPVPRGADGLSVLKPLRGVDDDLLANLESFADQDWPVFEVLLGLHDAADPAAPVAHAAAARWPGRFRVVIQGADLGMNPKVSQLASLIAAARYPILVISDSNVRVEPAYLSEIAARLEDPGVGLVTHLIAGVGERSVGALLENLHLAGGVATGIAAAKAIAGRDVVMGKSMALRREDLDAMGGFEPVKDLLAEDFVIGQMVPRLLGKRVELAARPVQNVVQDRTLAQFFHRARRWAVLQHALVGPWLYAGQVVHNPVLFATLALLAAPAPWTAAAWFAVAAFRALLDGAAGASLRPGGVRPAQLLRVPLKDLLLGLAWVEGFFRRTVNWRGTRLRVLSGTRLAPPGASR
ncbi:MAG: glycosyltransferase, partial [Deltaproteobacteria bacterium]